MLDLLKKICSDQTMVALYTDEYDSSRFICGKIVAANETEFAVYAITPSGKFDGVFSKQIADIQRIEMDSQYNKGLELLCQNNVWEKFPYKINNTNIRNSLLQIASETQKIVSIELNKSGFDDVVGLVKCISENICEVAQIDSFGKKDGVSFILLDDISQISYMSEQEEKIWRLYQKNNIF